MVKIHHVCKDALRRLILFTIVYLLFFALLIFLENSYHVLVFNVISFSFSGYIRIYLFIQFINLNLWLLGVRMVTILVVKLPKQS